MAKLTMTEVKILTLLKQAQACADELSRVRQTLEQSLVQSAMKKVA